MNKSRLQVSVLYKNGQEDFVETTYDTEAEAMAARDDIIHEWDQSTDSKSSFALLGDHFFVRRSQVARLSFYVDDGDGTIVRYFA